MLPQVAGELSALTDDHVRDKPKLRFGALAAVVMVTILYMLATAGYVSGHSTTFGSCS